MSELLSVLHLTVDFAGMVTIWSGCVFGALYLVGRSHQKRLLEAEFTAWINDEANIGDYLLCKEEGDAGKHYPLPKKRKGAA